MRRPRRVIVLMTGLFLFVVAQGFSRLATSGNDPITNTAIIPSPALGAHKNPNPQNSSINFAGQDGSPGRAAQDQNKADTDEDPDTPRSEERRVGKECRSRW